MRYVAYALRLFLGKMGSTRLEDRQVRYRYRWKYSRKIESELKLQHRERVNVILKEPKESDWALNLGLREGLSCSTEVKKGKVKEESESQSVEYTPKRVAPLFMLRAVPQRIAIHSYETTNSARLLKLLFKGGLV
jgi:hypothetical protein